jgi:hypothetical protein
VHYEPSLEVFVRRQCRLGGSQVTATHDFAGALGVYPSKRVLLVKLNRGARHRPPAVGEKSAKPSTLVSACQLQTTCDQRLEVEGGIGQQRSIRPTTFCKAGVEGSSPFVSTRSVTPLAPLHR